MAKKDKLKTGGFDLDSGLDFDNLDFGTPEFKTGKVDSKSRKPVSSLFKGTISGARNTIKDRAFLAKATRAALPKEYGEIMDRTGEVKDGLTSLYNDAVKSVKPELQRLTREVDKLIPTEAKRSKSFLDKMKKFVGVQDETKTPTEEEQREGQMNAELGSIFAMQAENAAQERAEDKAREHIKERIDSKRFETSFNLLSAISTATTRTAAYTEKINSAYQKKSLELQYRSYYVQAEMLKTQKNYFEVFRKAQEALILNTSLPEYAKTKASERFKDLAKNKFMDNLQGKLMGNGSFLRQGMNRLGKAAQWKLYQLQGIMSNAAGLASDVRSQREQMAEMNKMMEELGMGGEAMSGHEMAGSILGSFGLEEVAKMLGGKIRKGINGKSKLARGLKVGSKYANNIPGALTELLNSKALQYNPNQGGFKNGSRDIVRDLLRLFVGYGEDKRLNNGTGFHNLNDPGSATFNAMTQRSITTIIPGYLARIYREIQVLRTGNPGIGLTTYNHRNQMFQPEKKVTADIAKFIDKRARGNGFEYAVENTYKELTGGKKLSPAAAKALQDRIREQAMNNRSLRDSRMLRNGEMTKGLPKEIKDELQGLINERYAEGSEGIEDKDIKLSNSFSGLSNSVADVRGDIQALVNSGNTKELEKLGIIKRGYGGQYEINDNAYQRILREGGISGSRHKFAKSDFFSKKGIKLFDGKKALDFIKGTNIYKWAYKKGNSFKAGPMAQDVHKSLGNLGAPNGKQLDLTTMNGLNMAAIKHLSDRQDNQAISSIQLLAGIKLDTANMVNQLAGLTAISLSLPHVDFKNLKGIMASRGKALVEFGQGQVDKAKGLYEKNQSRFGDFLGATGDLAMSAYSNAKNLAMDGLKRGGRLGRKAYVKGKKFWRDNKEPMEAKLSEMFHTGLEFLGKAYDSARNFGSNLVGQYLPAGWNMAAKAASWGAAKLLDTVKQPADVYVKGRPTPMLLANLMKAGAYFNQTDGSKIRSPVDIKDAVVDAQGNVVLSLEDLKMGIVDNRGKQFRTVMQKILRNAKVSGYLLGKKVKAGLSAAKAFAKGALSGWKEKFKGFGFGFGGDAIDLLTEIRDILKAQSRNHFGSAGPALEIPDYGSAGGSAPSVMQAVTGGAPILTKANLAKGITATGKAGTWMKNRLQNSWLGRKTGGLMTRAGRSSAGGKLSSLWGRMKGSKVGGKIGGLLAGAKAFGGGVLNNIMGQGQEGEETAPEAAAGAAGGAVIASKANGTGTKQIGAGAIGHQHAEQGSREGNWQDRLEAQQARKAELDKNRQVAHADENPRYKSAKNVIDMMMEKAQGAYGAISEGLSSLGDAIDAGSTISKGAKKGGLLSKIGRWGKAGLKGGWRLGKGLIKGAVGLGSLVPGMGTMLGKVGSAALTVGRVAIPALASTAATAAGAVGSAAASALGGIATFLASPVVLGAAATALVAYGGYKLYKHMTRNDASLMGQARMAQYGLTKSVSEKYHFMFELENYLGKEVVGYDNGKAYLREKKLNPEKVFDIMGIDKSDDEMVGRFFKWFNERFKPIYLTHLTALYAVDPKASLDEADKLKGAAKAKYFNAAAFDNGPYSVLVSPFKDLDHLPAGKNEVSMAIESARDQIKISSKKEETELAKNRRPDGKQKTFMDKTMDVAKSVGNFALKALMLSPPVAAAKAVLKMAVSLGRHYGFEVSALEAVRFKTYGLKTLDHTLVSSLRSLEEECCKNITVGNDNQAKFNGDVNTVIKAVGGDFGISGPQADEAGDFTYWFRDRFMPVLLNFVGRGFKRTRKTHPQDIENSLNDTEKYDIATKILATGGVWSQTTSPWKKVVLNSDSHVTDDNIRFLAEKAKQQKDREQKLAPKVDQKPVGKTPVTPPKTSPAQQVVKQNGPAQKSGAAEGENQKSSGQAQMNKMPDVNMQPGKVNLAGGGLASPDSADQFIRLATGVKLDGLNPEFMKNFRMMVAEYGQKTGKVVTVTSGVRSQAQQMALYKKDPSKAAMPGKSLHEFGLALDIDSKALDDMDNLGLMRKYGFTRPVGGEPWHMESAGTQTDINRAKTDPNFASQVISSSLGLGGGGYGTMAEATKGHRNNDVALKLLDSSASIAKNDKDTVAGEIASNRFPEKAANQPEPKLPQAQTVSFNAPVPKKGVNANDVGGSIIPPTPVSMNNQSSANSNWGYHPDAEPGSFGAAKEIKGTPQGAGEVKSMITEVAKATGADPTAMLSFAAVESGMNPNARASGSSATGLFQFVSDTWKRVITKFGPKYNLDPNTPASDPKANALMGAEYIKQNAKELSSVKPNPSVTDLYLAHFLGPGGAKKFLKAGPNAIAAEVLPDAARANKSIFYQNGDPGKPLTTGQVYNLLSARIQKKAAAFGVKVDDKAVGTMPDNGSGGNYTASNGIFDPSSNASARSPGGQPQQDNGPFIRPGNNVLGGGPNPISTPSITPSYMPSGDSSGKSVNNGVGSGKTLDTISSTLTQQLDIQTQILTLLQKALGGKTGDAPTNSGDSNNNANNPSMTGLARAVSTVAQGAIDLSRQI